MAIAGNNRIVCAGTFSQLRGQNPWSSVEPWRRIVLLTCSLRLTEDRLHRILVTNIAGQFLCAKHAVLAMSTAHGHDGGAIVNVSSAASRLGSPGEYVDYAASKGAIDTLTIGLAREVAREAIRVNAVRPGFIRTEIHASRGDPHRVDRLEPSLPMKRGGTAQEVAAAIVWLLSNEASYYVTATFIDLAGGR